MQSEPEVFFRARRIYEKCGDIVVDGRRHFVTSKSGARQKLDKLRDEVGITPASYERTLQQINSSEMPERNPRKHLCSVADVAEEVDERLGQLGIELPVSTA